MKTNEAVTPSGNSEEADLVFSIAHSLAAGVQATLGRMSEVVVHDFRLGEHSVVSIAGDVTHRQVGSAMSEIGLTLLRSGDAAEDQLNYVTRLSDGRVMKSSTMLLRTSTGHVVGAFCVNLDVTQLRVFGGLLADLTGENDQAEPVSITFGNDMEAVIDGILDGIERRLGKPLTQLAPDEWFFVFKELDERGVFQIRNAVALLSARLGVSRATVYNYKARLQEGQPGADARSNATDA
jgi:predicted transcriptional regulator YheO